MIKMLLEEKEQFLAEMHRCYDALNVGICVIDDDEEETVLFVNQAVLDMYECEDLPSFLKWTGGRLQGMFHRGGMQVNASSSLNIPLRLQFMTSHQNLREAYGEICQPHAVGYNCYLLQLWCHQDHGFEQPKDDLTGLVSPSAFARQVEALVEKKKEDGAEMTCCAVYFDIANFRGFNREKGAQAGNRCLAYVVTVLKNTFPTGLFCRINADQFHAVVPQNKIAEKLDDVCARVNLYIGTRNASLKAGIFVPHSYPDPNEIQMLFEKAMIACETIKNDSNRSYAFFDEQMQTEYQQRSYILSHFDKALEAGYIRIYYQPVVHTYFSSVRSFEALSRWDDPERGMISPGIFVPVLEQARQIARLDQYVMKRVVESLHECLEHGLSVVPVSLNLSQQDVDLMDPLAYLNKLTLQLNVPRRLVHIEITERAIASNRQRMLEVIDGFHESGYEVWLDDFGSAYSSLNALHNYMFDTIKLDMEFFRNFDDRSRDIITSIIAMAKRLGMHTLAEGVETKQQLDFLKEIGCELIQGFYFGRPMPILQIRRYIEEKHLPMETELESAIYGAVGLIDLITENPIGIFLYAHDSIHVFAGNQAFIEQLESIGFTSLENFAHDLSSRSFPMRRKLEQYLEKVSEGDNHVITFVDHDQYIRMQAVRIAGISQFWAGTMGVLNISMDQKVYKTRQFDAAFRNLILLYDGIYCLDTEKDEIDIIDCVHPQLKPETLIHGVKDGILAYCRGLVHPDDHDRFLAFMDPDSLMMEIQASQGGYVQTLFRIKANDGCWYWTVFKATQVSRSGKKDILVCEARDLWESAKNRRDLLPVFANSLEPDLFADRHAESHENEDALAVFRAFLDCAGIPFFWKDDRQRFLGMNDTMLARLQKKSLADVAGRTERETGWLADARQERALEDKILQDGKPRNTGCFVNGKQGMQYVTISEFPWYRGNRIAGTAGLIHLCQETRGEIFMHDEETGLYNAYGAMMAGEAFASALHSSHENYGCIYLRLHDEASLRRNFSDTFCEQIMQAMAKSIRSIHLPAHTIAAHLHGCSFLLLGKEKDMQALVNVTNLLSDMVKNLWHSSSTQYSLDLDCAVVMGSEAYYFDGVMELLLKRMAHFERQASALDQQLACIHRVGADINVLNTAPERIILMDPRSTEILFMNKAMKQDLNLPEDLDVAGRKCYEILEGRTAVCPWCFNSLLSYETVISRQVRMDAASHIYSTRNLLINWQGRTVRFCIGNPSETAENTMTKDLLAYETWANDAIAIGMSEPDPSVGIEKTMEQISLHLQAERFLIFEERMDGTLACTYEWCSGVDVPLKAELQGMRKKDADALYQLFQSHKVVLIPDMNAFVAEHPDFHPPIAIANLISGHLVISGKSRGFTMVINSDSANLHPAGSMLSTLTDFLAALVRNRDTLVDAEEKGRRDPMTGALNRGGLEKYLERHGKMESFGLIACDINGLKDVNDGRGHLAGDKLIRQAASILMRYADCDHVVRMGGDEFLVLLENEDESRIWKIIDEVHQACEKEHFAIAMGYALQKGSTDHFDELLRRADQAMYADKGASHRKKS